MYEIWYGLLEVYAVPVGVFVRDGIFDALKSVVRGERQGVGDTPIIQHSTRDGRGEEVARAVAFFAREDAGYITGQVLCVDGGMAV